jgi:5,10-methenyltetrahydrofolate synthetase
LILSFGIKRNIYHYMSDPLNMTAVTGKAALRQTLLAARRALPPLQRATATAQIGQHLLNWCAQHAITRLGVYWPIRGEPDLQPWYAELHQRGVELALPVVVERDAALHFARWQPGQMMSADAFGVAIPEPLLWCALPDAILIPCVGFNRAGFRLGYGGGFYDRTLAASPRPRTLGVAFACQLAEFEADAHDVALDVIVEA